MTNYDKLTLEIITNGTITAADALKEASTVLVEHYNAIISGGPENPVESAAEENFVLAEEFGINSVSYSVISFQR